MTAARPCGICQGRPEDRQAAMAQLAEYIQSLPDDVRVCPEAYAARLAACGQCPQRVEDTCSLCGCFIRARAAKWRMRCPDVRNPRWGIGRSLVDEA